MATKSTPIKRKLESNSDTPSKKRNWLSLEDKLDIIKRFENGSSKVKIADEKGMAPSSVRLILKEKDKFFNKDHEMIPI